MVYKRETILSGRDKKGVAKKATARKKKPVSVLCGLAADEAHTVLLKLVDLHPDLRADAEALARALLRDRSCEAIAEDVAATLSGLEDDELYERSGAHSWGYVDSGDAAVDIVEDALKRGRQRDARGAAGLPPRLCVPRNWEGTILAALRAK